MIGKVFQAVLLTKDSSLEKDYAKLFKESNVDTLVSKIDSTMADYSDPAIIHLFENWLAISPNDIYIEESIDKKVLKAIEELTNSDKLFFTSPYDVKKDLENYKDEEFQKAVIRWDAQSNIQVKPGQVLYLSEYFIDGPFYINHEFSDFEEALKNGVITEIVTDEYNLGEFNDEHEFVIYVRLKDGTFSALEDGALKKYSFTCHKITSSSINSIKKKMMAKPVPKVIAASAPKMKLPVGKQTITITLSGYGGEIFAGKVDRKAYDYFSENKIDIYEYACGTIEDVPEEFQPFEPGIPYDCDNLFHCYGVELSKECNITVSDASGKTVFDSSLDEGELGDTGIEVEETAEDYYVSGMIESDEVALFGQHVEKGVFFDENVDIAPPFDPAKLKLIYSDYEGMNKVEKILYDDKEVEIENGQSTDSKANEYSWVLGEDVPAYKPKDKPASKKKKKK